MFQNIPTNVLTGEARLVNVCLTEPHVLHHNGETRYSVTLLIPKADAATIADVGGSITAAVLKTRTLADAFHFPIQDGDGEKPDGGPYEPECRGCWVIPASTWTKPQVVGVDDVTAELPPSDIYGGMYCRATLHFYAYDCDGAKGVGCTLGNILKTRDGERVYSPGEFSRVGAGLMRDAVREEQDDIMERLLAHLCSFGAQTVNHLKPEQYGVFADGLRALGAQI